MISLHSNYKHLYSIYEYNFLSSIIDMNKSKLKSNHNNSIAYCVEHRFTTLDEPKSVYLGKISANWTWFIKTTHEICFCILNCVMFANLDPCSIDSFTLFIISQRLFNTSTQRVHKPVSCQINTSNSSSNSFSQKQELLPLYMVVKSVSTVTYLT